MLSGVVDVPLAWATAAFLFLSALFHLLVVSPWGFRRYVAELERGRNRFRWVEYAMSSTLMIVLIALVTGITDDGDWYRVICPDDTIGDCFVVNDPVLIQPATPPGAPQSDTGEAIIERVELVYVNDFPRYMTAALYGNLPDACSQIDSAEALRTGTTFYIQMTTSHMANARCAPQATPFVQEVNLDMTGLPSGNYKVVAGSVSSTFAWEAPE